MASSNLDVTQTVAEWVANRPDVYHVFEKYRIDPCRDGDKTVIQACRDGEIEPQQLVEDLMRAAQPAHCEIGSDWDNASIGELCGHIEAVHHLHLRRELPLLSVLLQKVVEMYRDAHPELDELKRSFGRFRAGLERHLLTETTVLLPALRALEDDCTPRNSSSEYLAQLINRLEDDHAIVDEELGQMRQLTHGYKAPPHTCSAYAAMLDSLWELEWHLHKSIYEENDILFPRALRHQAALLHK